jgi:hypothetical protein
VAEPADHGQDAVGDGPDEGRELVVGGGPIWHLRAVPISFFEAEREEQSPHLKDLNTHIKKKTLKLSERDSKTLKVIIHL